MSIESGCSGDSSGSMDARADQLPSEATPRAPAESPGRELWDFVPDEARHARLSWAERVWVYNVFVLLPLYAAVVATTNALAGSDGWRDRTFSPWAGVTIAVLFGAGMQLFSWFLETLAMSSVSGGRRATAVLSRPLREGRHVWATARGDRVRVYRLQREHAHVPHLWSLSLGVRARIAGGREFSAEDEAQAAYDYAAEIERTSRAHVEAVAIVRVINDPQEHTS